MNRCAIRTRSSFQHRADEPCRTFHCGNRQQCGLHGPASGGGHSEANGSDLPEETRPAATLISLFIFFPPHFVQDGCSALPTSNSSVLRQSSQKNSKSGIGLIRG